MTEACPFFVFGAVGPFMWRKGRLQRPWCGGVSLDSARGGAEVLALSWIQDLSGVHGGGAISLAGCLLCKPRRWRSSMQLSALRWCSLCQEIEQCKHT